MKAIGFRQYGSVDVLEELQLPLPVIKPDDVLVRVAATSVNPADWRIRNGQFKFFIKKLPFITGFDVAGVVEKVGENVTRFKKGDRVYTMLKVMEGGGCAEFVAVSESALALIPSNLSFTEAASMPLTLLTALQALRDKAQVKSGMKVLINGASGGVGIFAVQIAKLMGAHVTAVCSGRNEALVRKLGADTVIDYTKENALSRRTQYDVVFDCVNTVGLRTALPALVKGGVLVSVNPILGNPISKFFMGLRGRHVESIMVRDSGADLDSVRDWIESGELHTVIENCYPLSQVAEAHQRSETQRVAGKLVIVVDEKGV